MTRPGTRRGTVAALAVALLLALVAVVLPASPAGAASALPVLLLGDSVTAGATSSIRAATRDYPGLEIDAKGCRGMLRSCAIGGVAPNTGLDALQARATVPPVVLIELGYNDADRLDGIDALLRAALDRGAVKVVWFTISQRRTTVAAYRTFNATVRAAAARWPQLRIADWQAWADAPRGDQWFTDGVHLTPAGNVAWAAFVRTALDEHVAGVAVPPPPTPPPPAAPNRCTASAETGITPALLAGTAVTGEAFGYQPVAPQRLADTRFGDPLGQGKVLSVPVAGRAGVPADASAAVVTVTAVDACAGGFLTVFPCVAGGPPLASTVNVTPDGVRANSVVAGLAGDGSLCIYAFMRTDVVVDVMGWFGPSGVDGLRTAAPTRLLDTREQLASRLPGGTAVRLQVTGQSPLAPATATAVLVNVTGVDFAGAGYVTAWPADLDGRCVASERPGTSTVNVSGAEPVPSQTVVPVGGGGAICLFAFTAGHLVVDLGGWVEPGAPDAATRVPLRILDSRNGTGTAAGLVPTGGVVALVTTGGDTGVPAGASGVVLNVTGVDAPAPGFVTIWPAAADGSCSVATMPGTSSLNLPAGTPVPNLAIVKPGGNGVVCLYTQAGAHLVADLVGHLP